MLGDESAVKPPDLAAEHPVESDGKDESGGDECSDDSNEEDSEGEDNEDDEALGPEDGEAPMGEDELELTCAGFAPM